MALSPPKFIQMLRKRDQDDLLARLRALADDWESPEGKTNFSAKIGEDYAGELRKVIDLHKH